MIKSEFEAYNCEVWYENKIRERNGQAVIKLYDENGFKDSIIIPSVYYPLNNNNYEIFTSSNTHLITEEEYPEVIKAFDKTEYKIGNCYTNSDNLYKQLLNAGVKAEIYAGWIFTFEQYPVHHSWVVFRDGDKKSVLDLSQHLNMQFAYKEKYNIDTGDSREDVAEVWKIISKFSNSIRCYPLGIPSPANLYIGCPATAKEGRELFQNLWKKYPFHKSVPFVDKNGYSATQKRMIERKEPR